MDKCPKCGSPKFFIVTGGGSHQSRDCQVCHSKEDSRRTQSLSLGEIKYIDLLKMGLSSKEMGKELNREESTVKNALYSARAKLGAKNSVHMVYICMKEGIIE